MKNYLKFACSLLSLFMLCATVSANDNACPASVNLEKGKILTVVINNRVLKASESARVNGKASLVFSQYDVLSQEYTGAHVATCIYSIKDHVTSDTVVSARNTGLLPNLKNPSWADGKRVLPDETQWKCYPGSVPCDWTLEHP